MDPRTVRGELPLDHRTVVIVDEASEASTLDLDPLVTAAGRAGAEVVLVGDPAQIGVVNGPGGMLAAPASAGHGVDLVEIHRFSSPRGPTRHLKRSPGAVEGVTSPVSAGPT